MVSPIPFYDEILLGVTVSAIFLNFYVIYLIFHVMPKSMHDFRHCLFLFSFYDTIFAITMGPVLDVAFQAPALAGVLRGPVVMFIYRTFGYNMCKAITCFAFYILVSILCTQNYGVFFRFFAILPNKTYYEWFNAIPGYVYCYGGAIGSSVIYAVLVYFVLNDENELPAAMLEYDNDTFTEYQPGKNILIIGNMNSVFWYLLVGTIAVGLIYIEGNSYVMFFIARHILNKYAGSFSKQTYSLHRQFLYLLIIQITMPILLIVTPVMFLIYQRYIGLTLTKIQADCGTLLAATYSTVNVLLTIFCVSPFRRYTKRITIDAVLKLFGVKVDAATISIVQPAATESLNFNSRI